MEAMAICRDFKLEDMKSCLDYGQMAIASIRGVRGHRLWLDLQRDELPALLPKEMLHMNNSLFLKPDMGRELVMCSVVI